MSQRSWQLSTLVGEAWRNTSARPFTALLQIAMVWIAIVGLTLVELDELQRIENAVIESERAGRDVYQILPAEIDGEVLDGTMCADIANEVAVEAAGPEFGSGPVAVAQAGGATYISAVVTDQTLQVLDPNLIVQPRSAPHVYLGAAVADELGLTVNDELLLSPGQSVHVSGILDDQARDQRTERWILFPEPPQDADACWVEFGPGVEAKIATDVLRTKTSGQASDVVIRQVESGGSEVARIVTEGRIGRLMSVGLGVLTALTIVSIRMIRRRELAIYRFVGSGRMDIATIEILNTFGMILVGGLSAFPAAVFAHQLLGGARHSQQVLETAYRSCLVAILIAMLLSAVAAVGIPTRNLLEDVRD